MRDVAIREIDIASGKAPHPSPLRGVDTVSHEREKKTHALVRIKQVSKAFATAAGAITALDDVSLDIAENEFFTLLGPSGCGKTTLLRLLAGFEHPDAGRVLLDGKSLVEAPPHKRPVNIVFQSYALFPHMSVAQNVAFGLEQQGIARKATRARVDEMLALVRLDAMATRSPMQLSGGQQQRVALARALAPNPKLLLLDEPLSALDVKLRRGMQVELKRIQRETGVTFLLVTHDQEEALSMSDRIAVMNEGRVLQVGAPHDIYESPRSRFVADFMGANVVPGALVGASCAFAAIRPERIGLAKDGEDGIPGSIEATTYLGAKSAWLVALDDGTRIKVEGDWPRFAAGHSVRCTLPPSALVPLDA